MIDTTHWELGTSSIWFVNGSVLGNAVFKCKSAITTTDAFANVPCTFDGNSMLNGCVTAAQWNYVATKIVRIALYDNGNIASNTAYASGDWLTVQFNAYGTLSTL